MALNQIPVQKVQSIYFIVFFKQKKCFQCVDHDLYEGATPPLPNPYFPCQVMTHDINIYTFLHVFGGWGQVQMSPGNKFTICFHNFVADASNGNQDGSVAIRY